jgi:DNA-binding CsgD family transcriptional regulator
VEKISMLIWEDLHRKYFVKFSDRILAVTRPLKDHFGISFFGYHRIDMDGRYTVLTNRPDWVEDYIAKQLYHNDPFLQHPDNYSEGACLYSTIDADKEKRLFKSWGKKVQADEGMILIQKDANAVEFFIFAGHQHHDFSRLYLNHLSLLRTYSMHFKQEMKPILFKQKDEGYTLPISSTACQKNLIQPKIDLKKKESFILSMGQEKVWRQFFLLSPQEKECLKQIQQGKTIKETAAVLFLSPRTVESYLENIRNKIDCTSKQDLISKAKIFASYDLL